MYLFLTPLYACACNSVVPEPLAIHLDDVNERERGVINDLTATHPSSEILFRPPPGVRRDSLYEEIAAALSLSWPRVSAKRKHTGNFPMGREDNIQNAVFY